MGLELGWGGGRRGCRLAASFPFLSPLPPSFSPFYAKIMMFIFFWHLAWVLFFFVFVLHFGHVCVVCLIHTHTYTFVLSFLAIIIISFFSRSIISLCYLLCFSHGFPGCYCCCFFLLVTFLPHHRDFYTIALRFRSLHLGEGSIVRGWLVGIFSWEHLLL